MINSRIFKIATWNINSVNSRIQHLIEFINKHDPDVICLQELKCIEDKFPKEELSSLPYNLYISGQKSYNGVAILSKIPADEFKINFPENPLPSEARFIEVSFSSKLGYLRIISLYAPNGGEAYSDKYKTKLDFYDKFTSYIDSIKTLDEKLFICSDFNIAPFDIDVHNPQMLQNTTCFTLAERKKLRAILNNGFEDAYRVINPDREEFTWWDYRAGAFNKNQGMRIDSILISNNTVDNLSNIIIDKEFRTKERPSDHAPVILSL